MKTTYLFIYLIIINLMGLLAAAIDKFLAIKKLRRISEKSLFSISAFGGAMFMYIAMRSLRHKTRHKRFMIGLPCMVIVQFALILICKYYGILY